ncbi:MAG: Negative regulator of genetic competence ClpC/MecB [Elusimicrobia bacterium ADurb.Bin231]|nr:MAG: Negative regulator of genetic competence ClpC/MecB [Elusimicrobia bacterium ADurb.Bin231]
MRQCDKTVGWKNNINGGMTYIMYNRFTERAQKVIRLAQEEAKRLNHDAITPEHLLIGILVMEEGVAAGIISNLGISTIKLRMSVEKILAVGDNLLQYGELPLTPNARKVLEYAIEEAQKLASGYVGTEHILLGLLRNPQFKTTIILENFGLGYDMVKDEISNMMGKSVPSAKNMKNKSRTPTLDEFGRDLTEMAKEDKLDPIIGRENEIERLIQILSRRTKNNPVLIGDPGVGKTAIVEGLAQKIYCQDVPEILVGKRVVTLDLSGVVAGTKYRGEFEQRIKTIMDEIRKEKNNIILFIDELHTIIGAGAAEGAIDASNMLKPALARGELQCVGATTINEYKKHIERDAALERRFQPIMVNPPSLEETIKILNGLKEKYEEHHKVIYSDEAISSAVELADRYITDRYFPDKAIDLLDEAGSRRHLNIMSMPAEFKEMETEIARTTSEKETAINAQDFEKAAHLRDKEETLRRKLEDNKKRWREKIHGTRPAISGEDMAIIISQWTGIPLTKLTEKESERLISMEQELHKRVIGQDEAVSSISHAVRRARMGLKEPKKPIGTFIFLGPTGVGKTELAKALAEFMFGHEDLLITIDMSEYMEKFSVSHLIGAPPGYVGYDEGGYLTEQVRRKPYSVILLDEIEKAHPDVLNILLQIMDTGSLNDNLGHKVSFKNTVIIMTSNMGAREISYGQSLGFIVPDGSNDDFASIQETVTNELKKTLNPEFLNRIDNVIVFHQLRKEEMKEVLNLQLNKVAKKVMKQGLSIDITDSAKEFLLDKGFDVQYGARPLNRVISKYLEDGLAEELLAKKITKGAKISITYSAEIKKLVFNVLSEVKL